MWVFKPVVCYNRASSMERHPLPNKKSAIKRVDIAERNRKRNSAYKGAARTAIKKASLAALAPNASPEALNEAFRKAQSLLDRAVLKGILSKNKAARDKARLAKRLNKAQQAG
jgi:small subunit ribosomal protein S20